MNRRDKEQVMDIGGVFTLVLVEGPRGFHGHYTNNRTGMTCSYDGSGLSKKQIVTKFWDKVRAIQKTDTVA